MQLPGELIVIAIALLLFPRPSSQWTDDPTRAEMLETNKVELISTVDLTTIVLDTSTATWVEPGAGEVAETFRGYLWLGSNVYELMRVLVFNFHSKIMGISVPLQVNTTGPPHSGPGGRGGSDVSTRLLTATGNNGIRTYHWCTKKVEHDTWL